MSAIAAFEQQRPGELRMVEANKVRLLSFSDRFVEARIVENARQFPATGCVINLSNEPLIIEDSVPQVVPAWKSTNFRNGIIAKAERAAIITVPSTTDLGGITFGEGWDWFGNRLAKFPRNTPLYISCYDWIGTISANPFIFSNSDFQREAADHYRVRLNLWWSPANTDCFIHNEHPFLEIHTQIHGSGRIQFFRERDEMTLYREISMMSGYTHDPFVHVTGQRDWAYPWHRYFSDSDAMWLAIELHPADETAV
jgi:hypothetical protein